MTHPGVCVDTSRVTAPVELALSASSKGAGAPGFASTRVVTETPGTEAVMVASAGPHSVAPTLPEIRVTGYSAFVGMMVNVDSGAVAHHQES